MTTKRAMELLCIERACVRRGSGMDWQMQIDDDFTDRSGYVKVTEECNRDCANCELVQDSKELLEMYDYVIRLMIDKTVEEEEKEKANPEEWRDWQRNCDPQSDLVI